MRNLKRALSLALASVMLLGMMVVGAGAASYPDVDDNDNVEAIDVLNAVEVMIGRQGNFEPDESVNRHEMAVIMAKLYLGVETADNYVGTHPFTDVVPWADKYVAACYENGLVAGTSATTFSGSKNLTAVEAAAMMLRALGYKDLSKGYSDWRVPVTATANQIRLFNGVASIPSAKLNRNQVAQLALNTLKSSVVDLKDNTLNLTNEDGKVIVTGGSREYIVRSSYESYARAINNTETAGTSASSVSGYTIELGEHLYNGKLRLSNDVDDFGRPSRVWEYDGKDIGTYVREDLLRDSYTVKVKGSDVYDDLGTVSIRDSDLLVYVDGVPGSTIVKNELARTNRENLAPTGKGALTQVFYDYENKTVTITVINTYLAQATSDYNESTDRGNLTVYGYDKPNKVKKVLDAGGNTEATYSNIKSDDVASVVDLKEDEYYLVTISDGDLMSIEPAQVLEDQEITSLKVKDWVNTGSQKYDFSAAYDYDFEHVLTSWDIINMEDATYNLYFDKYGYVVGADLFDGNKNYVFITGYDQSGSNYSGATVTANAIFTDGTQSVIKVDAKKSDPSLGSTAVGSTDKWDESVTGNAVITNKWYTYSLSGDVYTLKLADQVWDNGTGHDGKINAARNGLVDAAVTGHNTTDATTVPTGYFSTGAPTSPQTHSTNKWVYGDTETNYIIVHPNDNIDYLGKVGAKRYGIADVDKVVTGVRNVDITMFKSGDPTVKHGTSNTNTYGAYAVYDSDFHIVAAVVIGVDSGNNNYVYVTKGTPNEEAIRKDNSGNWYWQFDVITKEDGLTTKTLKGSYGFLQNMANNGKGLYTFRYDGDGYVTGVTSKALNSFVGNKNCSDDLVYDVGFDASPAIEPEATTGIASDPTEVVDSTGDARDALAWVTRDVLYANGRTLNGTVGGTMEGVHLAPDAKIYTNLRVNDGWSTEEYSSLASAVGALTYNGNTPATTATKRVYAILNSNGEADVLVIEIARNYNTNQQGDYGTSGSLTITGVSFSADGARVNYKNGSNAYIVSSDTAIVTITGDNGNLIYTGNSTAMTNTPRGAEGFVTFGNYVATPTSGRKYTVEMTITSGGNTYTGIATLDRS